MSEEVAPGNIQPLDPDPPPEVTISKNEDRRRLGNYLNQDDVQELLGNLTKSTFAPYKKPNSAHEHCINIFGVGQQKKIKDNRDSANCSIMNMWRQYSESCSLSSKVPLELSKATENLKKGGSQSSITSFFVRKPKVHQPSESEIVLNIDAENNNSQEENPQSSSSNEQKSMHLSVFGVTKSRRS